MNNQITMNPKYNLRELLEAVERDGIAFFEADFSQEEFVAFGNKFGEIYVHRDAASNGITVVKSIMNSDNVDSGFHGLTSSELFPHTDRSTLNEPPNILILYCKMQSGVGGESTLVDIRKVVEELISRGREPLHPIFEPNSVIFDDGKTRHHGSIIEQLSDGSYYLRYRNDEFSYFNSKIFPFIREFESNLLNKKNIQKLKQGQGYIINNGRFLHGRNEFSGNREMWRLLLFDNFMKQKGFIIENIYEHN